MNKIILYVLIGLLVVCIAGAGYYYFAVHKPMEAEYESLKNTKPLLEKANNELKKLKEREAKVKQETAWVDAGVAALGNALKSLVEGGKAEVVPSGNRIVINVAESVLFTPFSITFAKDGKPVLDALALALKEFNDKEIIVGNVTVPSPPTGKGRKKKPGKDARTIASGRSVELVKFLEKNGVSSESLIASAYPPKLPDHGFLLKDKKTIIVISPPAAAKTTAAPAQQAVQSAAPTAPAAAPAQDQQKPIPITTPPPKKVQ